MKRLIVAFSSLAIGLIPSIASAFPNVIYNPANGNSQFVNDTPALLFAMYIISPNHRITGTALPISGAIVDNFDQPYGLAYLNMPPGTHNAGSLGRSLPNFRHSFTIRRSKVPFQSGLPIPPPSL
jgi:hypothetical protein